MNLTAPSLLAVPLCLQGSPMRRQLAAAAAGETGGVPSGSQPGSGGQSPAAAGTPRSSGILNAGAPSCLPPPAAKGPARSTWAAHIETKCLVMAWHASGPTAAPTQ